LAGLKHSFEYAAARTIAAAAGLLSPRAADRFGAALGTLTYHLLSSRRIVAHDNIKSTIGQNLSEKEIEKLSKKVFQNIGRTIIEIARFSQVKLEGARKIIVSDHAGILKKVHDEGKGGIILTAHFGNWELLGSWPATAGYPMHFLVGTQHNSKVDRMLTKFRRAMGVEIIPLDRQIKSVFKVLKENEFVGVAADQHAPVGIKVKFLGRDALYARGPALFSIRTGAPICPFLIRREAYDRHVITAHEPIYPPNSGDEEKDIHTMTQSYAKFFEAGIRHYPDQWMWTHRRWKLESS